MNETLYLLTAWPNRGIKYNVHIFSIMLEIKYSVNNLLISNI